MAHLSQMAFQDGASPAMEELIFFHDHGMMVLAFILSAVGWSLMSLPYSYSVVSGLLEGHALEALWTTLPGVVLISVAMPSLFILYAMDEGWGAHMVIKALGHQWYWSYEYSNFKHVNEIAEFDSYMLPYEGKNQIRLLDVDNRTVVPLATCIQVLISSTDVLHAWTVPSLGVKADACPGRLNQVEFLAHRAGVFFGQCSEICGANHSFMPIVIEAVNAEFFLNWLSS